MGMLLVICLVQLFCLLLRFNGGFLAFKKVSTELGFQPEMPRMFSFNSGVCHSVGWLRLEKRLLC